MGTGVQLNRIVLNVKCLTYNIQGIIAKMRGGAVVACQAHNPEVNGQNPTKF